MRQRAAPDFVANFRTFYRLIADMIGTAEGVVVVTNLHRGVAEGNVCPFLITARVVTIHCSVDRYLSFQRFVERLRSSGASSIGVGSMRCA